MSTSVPSVAATTTNNIPYTSFTAGVTATLRTWSALKTAVEQSWGGSESAKKAEDLRSNILTYFDGQSPTPKMTQYELEDNLSGYMEEEYGVVLEDESEREVADLIWRMYECCARGDCKLADEVVRNAILAEEKLKGSGVKSVIQNGDEDDDDDDDMNDVADGGQASADNNVTNSSSLAAVQQTQPAATVAASTALEYSSGYLFGGPPKPKKELPPPRQLGEAEPEKPQPEVDDDGFAMVVTKKKGGRR